MTTKKCTLDFAGAIDLAIQGQPVTRKIWPHSRILYRNDELIIQHNITMPGVTPWLYTFADMAATDYVPAYFNEDTTVEPEWMT